MSRIKHGFTIVELLIVIVVIAILASISVVAYNGIQTRAKNAKTVAAASAWAKAIRMYNAETGLWPTNSCLGTITTYGASGSHCWTQNPWYVNQTFLNQLAPYLSSQPEPDTTDITNGGASTPRRGAFYHNASTGERYLWLMLLGTGACPDVGVPYDSSPTTDAIGKSCRYRLD